MKTSRKIYNWLNDLVFEIYYEKDYRNYYERGGNFRFLKMIMFLPLFLVYHFWKVLRNNGHKSQ